MPAAFIAESILSCGGQIPLPKAYLREVYEKVRAIGGVYIADEVQAGVGRAGKSFRAFELQEVVPDIVTLGKPIGNGHPLAAVVCKEEVANAFANGMEQFNTFGGNPVSCAIGREVLAVIKREGLQKNALTAGDYLIKEFKTISQGLPFLTDVRGYGLFPGIELVDEHLKPLTALTSALANRTKDYKVLMSADGRDNNVLKIQPPICFNLTDAHYLLSTFERLIKEYL